VVQAADDRKPPRAGRQTQAIAAAALPEQLQEQEREDESR
jgi:hypothetical protein